MEYVIIGLLFANLILVIVVLLRMTMAKQQAALSPEEARNMAGHLSRELSDSVSRQTGMVMQNISAGQSSQRKELAEALSRQYGETREILESLETQYEGTQKELLKVLGELKESNATALGELKESNGKALAEMKDANTQSITQLRNENQAALDRMNDTVNEKLQKTLNDRISQSFELVNKRLAEVYESLGEMKSVANGVNDLKGILSNVKTRGTLGEVQLEAILEEILIPEQFEKQYKLVPGRTEIVDFAVKLPGAEEGESIYLPVDSKFPGVTYGDLLAAYDSGDAEAVREARKLLKASVRKSAKDIHDKYICPPYTTDFAIMFLPFEGLYMEVVNMGALEELQNEFHVNIAGPSTMAALLNSLRMGFKTLAIQRRSGEVWKTLEAVKKEFSNFEDGLNKMKERLGQADDELEKLIGRRTNAINRRLREVSEVDSIEEADAILGIKQG